ncbi:MAG TPA: terminase family protein [Thermoanaerobaculia bacterium]|nr:terminase family protein [Thermoanaerobaculia bacterium]
MLASDLSQDLAFALDPVLIAREVGLDSDPWQERFLRQPANRTLLNASRQSGKSTVTGILAAHTALYDPASLTLLLSPTQRQSHELFRKALDAYRAIPTAIPIVQESALRLELANGSRIVSLPGKETTVRGFSGVRLLAVDEAARVPDELYFSVRPMLAVSGGRLVALSTPFGTRGWWYDAWRSKEAWERYEVPARECPRISSEFLEEERRSMGDWWYQQEYECTFLDAETQPFGREDVERAFAEEVEAWDL